MSKYKEFVKEVLRQSSTVALDYFGKVSVIKMKPGDQSQVLTEADLAIGKFITGMIKKRFPRHNIIDEEAGVIDHDSEFTWVIDPIDGTANFSEGIPLYGIIIGLLKGAKPVAGGIALPAFQEIYVAEKDKGAFLNGKRLRMANKGKLSLSLVAFATENHKGNFLLTKRDCDFLAHLILRIRNLRAGGSVWDGVMVAKGKYGGYLCLASKIWDNVGLQIVIEEAGGVYTDFFGKPIDYSNPLGKSKNNFTFCMASPGLHRQLQKLISKWFAAAYK